MSEESKPSIDEKEVPTPSNPKEESNEASDEQPTQPTTATTAPKATEEHEDILVSGWFYIDASGNQQGPFSTKEMCGWFSSGFFQPTLKVKRVKEDDFVPLSARKEITEASTINGAPPAKRMKMDGPAMMPYPMPMPMPMPYPYFNPMMAMAPYPSTPAQSSEQEEIKVTGVFNAFTGRFVSSDTQSHWEKKGLPSDRETRMMAHYFDVNSYQDQMRQAKAEPPQRQKLTKKQVEDFKKRKEEKKKKRLLQNL